MEAAYCSVEFCEKPTLISYLMGAFTSTRRREDVDGLELKVLRVRARLTQWDLALRWPVADAVVKVLHKLLQDADVPRG